MKIVSVIVCAFVFGGLALATGGAGVVSLTEAIFTDRYDSTPKLVFELLQAAVWLIGILGAALGGYVGYWLIPNKDK